MKMRFQSASDQHKFQTTVEHLNSGTQYISLERNQLHSILNCEQLSTPVDWHQYHPSPYGFCFFLDEKEKSCHLARLVIQLASLPHDACCFFPRFCIEAEFVKPPSVLQFHSIWSF